MDKADLGDRIELIDFGSDVPHSRLSYGERVNHGAVTISRCALRPNPGDRLGAHQLVAVVHDGQPFDMAWRLPESDREQSARIVAGDIHLNPADHPLAQRWQCRPRILVVALESSFVEKTIEAAFGTARATDLRTMIGIRDDVITSISNVWRRELVEGGAGGRVYAESLGTALAVHIFRSYSDRLPSTEPIKGGLGAGRLRKVVDYMEAYLVEDLSLAGLAEVTGLSTHHFGEAFKATTGRPPHQYLIERRVQRAKELLLARPDLTIARIAHEVGFASHSHFTLNFKKVTGSTPSRFRVDHS